MLVAEFARVTRVADTMLLHDRHQVNVLHRLNLNHSLDTTKLMVFVASSYLKRRKQLNEAVNFLVHHRKKNVFTLMG